MRAALAAVAALLATSCITLARADVYTWTDANGRVQYSDKPPKNFTGVVKRVDVDETPAAAPQPKPAEQAGAPKAPAARAAPAQLRPGASDVADRRRAERARLQRNLDAAREKVAAARKALADHEEPGDGERQIVQRPGGDGTGSPMPGVVPAASRLNCRSELREGKKVITCPVSMPSEGYYARTAQLEAALKTAEEELADAERAYRRGVD